MDLLCCASGNRSGTNPADVTSALQTLRRLSGLDSAAGPVVATADVAKEPAQTPEPEKPFVDSTPQAAGEPQGVGEPHPAESEQPVGEPQDVMSEHPSAVAQEAAPKQDTSNMQAPGEPQAAVSEQDSASTQEPAPAPTSAPVFSQPWWDEEIPRLIGDWKYNEQGIFHLQAVEAAEEQPVGDAVSADASSPPVLRWSKTFGSGRKASGALQPEDDWLVAAANWTDTGEAYGTVRVRLQVGGDEDIVLSNVKPVGQDFWSDDLTAKRASAEEVKAVHDMKTGVASDAQVPSRPSMARRFSQLIFGKSSAGPTSD